MINIWILKKKSKKLIKELRSIFDKNKIYLKLQNHNKNILEANFWQNKSHSKKVLKEKKLYEDLINSYETSKNKLNDLNDLNQLALDEDNVNIQNEIFENIKDLRELVKKK